MPGRIRWSDRQLEVARTINLYRETPVWFQAERSEAGFRQKRQELGLSGVFHSPKPTEPTDPTEDEESGWGKRWEYLETADAMLEQLTPIAETTTWTSPDPGLPVGIVFV